VGGAMWDNLSATLDALDKAVALLVRLDTLPAEHQVYIKQVKTRVRWTVKHLSEKAYKLACDIEAETHTVED
jgi:thioesterase domain-containing protein